MSSLIQITIQLPKTESFSGGRALDLMPVMVAQNVDVLMEDASKHLDMEVDEKIEFYHSSSVFNGGEAICTLKAALKLSGQMGIELVFSKIIVERPMNSFFLGDKRGIVYGFDQEGHPTFAIYISLDGVGSVIHASNPFMPILKKFGEYVHLRRFYMDDL
ncbi:hypothetical protein ONZ45_g11208 [Pleurotus djamor]|nr:hypothetical protein ONZ45_g11208 [Pleurotus djamor]